MRDPDLCLSMKVAMEIVAATAMDWLKSSSGVVVEAIGFGRSAARRAVIWAAIESIPTPETQAAQSDYYGGSVGFSILVHHLYHSLYITSYTPAITANSASGCIQNLRPIQ